MQRIPRIRLAFLVLCLITAGLAFAGPSSIGAQTTICTGGIYADSQTAKANFEDDCGKAFQATTEHRCDWVPDGWQCQGPGDTSSAPAPTPTPEPEPERADTGGSNNSDGTCTGGIYDDVPTAKSNFADDCGQAFQSTSQYRCDWVPGGWQCQGPGNATGNDGSGDTGDNGSDGSTANPTNTAPTRPSIIDADSRNSRYTSIAWRLPAGAEGVNVFRTRGNGAEVFVGSVNRPGTVFNDYSGRPGDVYRVIAYDNDTDLFSDPSNSVTVVINPPELVLASRLGEGVVYVAWASDTGANNGDFKIYRDGALLADLRNHKPGYLDETARPGSSHNYQVVSTRSGAPDGPKSPTVTISATVDPAQATVAAGQYMNAQGVMQAAENLQEVYRQTIFNMAWAGGVAAASGGWGLFRNAGAALFRFLLGASGPLAYNEVTYGDFSPATDAQADFESGLNSFLDGQGSSYQLPLVDPSIRFNVNHPDFEQWKLQGQARDTIAEDVIEAQIACQCKLTNAEVQRLAESVLEEFRNFGLRNTWVGGTPSTSSSDGDCYGSLDCAADPPQCTWRCSAEDYSGGSQGGPNEDVGPGRDSDGDGEPDVSDPDRDGGVSNGLCRGVSLRQVRY